MDTFFPGILLAYLEPFRQAFTSPSFETFKTYAWAMMVVKGSKCMTKIVADRPPGGLKVVFLSGNIFPALSVFSVRIAGISIKSCNCY